MEFSSDKILKAILMSPQSFVLLKVAPGNYQRLFSRSEPQGSADRLPTYLKETSLFKIYNRVVLSHLLCQRFGQIEKMHCPYEPLTLDGVSHAPRDVRPVDFQEEWR